MPSISLHYTLSEAGRRASLAAGGDGKREQVLTAEATPEMLTIATVDPEGNASLRIGVPLNGSGIPFAFESPQTAEALATFEVQRRSTAAQERAERREKAVKAYLLLDVPRIDYIAGAWQATPVGEGGENDLRVAPLYAEAKEDAARANASDAKAAADARAAGESERRLRAAMAAESTTKWVSEHGSPWLRKMMAAGMFQSAYGTYMVERLAIERPGWAFRYAHTENVLAPTETMLDALAEAKLIDEDVALRCLAEHEAGCKMLNERCRCAAKRQAVLVGVFLGKRIMKVVGE